LVGRRGLFLVLESFSFVFLSFLTNTDSSCSKVRTTNWIITLHLPIPGGLRRGSIKKTVQIAFQRLFEATFGKRQFTAWLTRRAYMHTQ
jgi:hypothetical protein